MWQQLTQALLTLVVAVNTQPAGEPLKPDPRSSNAAERYFALTNSMSPALAKQAGLVEFDAHEFKVVAAEEYELTVAGVRKELESNQPWFEELISITGMKDCEFGLRPEEFGVLVPRPPPPGQQLSPFRKLARSLGDEACRRWVDGDKAGAVRCSVAILRMARHLRSGEHVPIMWSITASSVIAKGEYLLESMSEAEPEMRAIDPALWAELRHAVDSFDAADPVWAQRTDRATRTRFLRFAEEQLAGDSVGDRLVIHLVQVGAAEGLANNFLRQLARQSGADGTLDLLPKGTNVLAEVDRQSEHLTHEELRAALAESRLISEEINRAWEGPDGAARVDEICKREVNDPTSMVRCVTATAQSANRCTRDAIKALDHLRTLLSASKPRPGAGSPPQDR